MNKKYMILSPGKGIATLQPENGGTGITFELENTRPLSSDEVLSGYAISGGEKKALGIMLPPRGSFKLSSSAPVDAVAVFRKNVNSGSETAEFWGGDESLKSAILQAAPETDKSESEALAKNQTGKAKNQETEVLRPAADGCFSFESFFGISFAWTRINGYFIPYNYNILNYIISARQVYRCINYSGHYYLGKAELDGVRYFAVAVPQKHADAPPFEHLSTTVYTIKNGDTVYDAVCVGIDKSGEFFSVL